MCRAGSRAGRPLRERARIRARKGEPVSERRFDKSERVDLSDEAVHWDLGSSLSYSEYLRLDKLLDAQKPLTYRAR